MSVADRIRSLLNRKKPAQARELASELAGTRAAHEAAQVKASQERLLHPKHVLAGAAEAAKHRELLVQLDGEVSELAVLLAVAEERYAATMAEEAEAARVAKYEEAAKLQAEVAEELVAKYPELAAGLLRLLHRVTYADNAICTANEDLPEGRDRLDLVEAAVRDAEDLPRKALQERVVALWAYPDGKQPLSDDLQERVSSPNGHTGHIVPRSNDWTPSGQPVVKKRFRRIEYQAALQGHPGDRLVDMKLPALHWRDPDLWTPGEIYRPTHADTLRRLNEVVSGVRRWLPSERPVEVEYVLTKDPADAGAN